MRGAGVVVGVMAVCGAAMVESEALAEKKKPGLFDFDTWKTPQQRQRDAAQQLAPGSFDLTPAVTPPPREPRVIRLRIYVDRDYRGGVLRYRARARAQIDRVNRVVQAVFGARFDIESVRDWDRAHVGVPFEAMLRELETLDPGKDVDWVLGLVTPFRGVSSSIHALGYARLLSRHFLLRGMDDEQEGLALDREFRLMSGDERGRLYEARKAHKEVVCFLHEWAHTLGALHAEDPAVLMNPAYDPRQAAFSDFELRLIVLGLEHRLARPAAPDAEAADLQALLAGIPASEGSDKDRLELQAAVHARGERAAAVASGQALDIPAADVGAYNQAVEALNAGHRDQAWARLDPVVRKHPRQATVGALACSLVTGHENASRARAVCDAAVELAPGDPRPLLAAAAAYVRAGDLAQAAPLVAAAWKRAGAGTADADSCLRLARLAGAVGALTVGEAALTRATGAHADAAEARKVGAELEAARHRLALPHDAARFDVGEDREPAYAALFWDAIQAVGSKRPDEARARGKALAAAFPGAPGTDLAACELELRAGHDAAATRRCDAAVAKFDEASRAHFLLGVLAARARRDVPAEKHLRKAIQLDPEDPSAWQELGRVFRATRASQRLAQLRAEHQTLFSTPLPE